MFVSNSAPQSIQRVFDNSISSSNEKYIQFLENKILNVQQKLEDLYEKDISDEEQLIEEIDKLQSMESKYVNLLRKKQMEIKMDIARSHAMSVQFNNMNNISFNQPHQQNLVSTTAEPHYEEHPDTDNNNEQADESTPNRYQRLLGSEPFYMNNKIGMEDTHIQTENDEQPPATNQTPIVLQRDPVDTADQPSNKNSAREIVKNGIESKIKMMMEARAQKETSDAGIVRIEAEKEAKIDAEKKAKREAEAKARREAESKAAAVAAEKARKEAEAKVTIERAKKEAQTKAAAERAKKEAQAKAAAEKARREAEAKAAIEKAKREAEAKLLKARKEAEAALAALKVAEEKANQIEKNGYSDDLLPKENDIKPIVTQNKKKAILPENNKVQNSTKSCDTKLENSNDLDEVDIYNDDEYNAQYDANYDDENYNYQELTLEQLRELKRKVQRQNISVIDNPTRDVLPQLLDNFKKFEAIMDDVAEDLWYTDDLGYTNGEVRTIALSAFYVVSFGPVDLQRKAFIPGYVKPMSIAEVLGSKQINTNDWLHFLTKVRNYMYRSQRKSVQYLVETAPLTEKFGALYPNQKIEYNLNKKSNKNKNNNKNYNKNNNKNNNRNNYKRNFNDSKRK